MGGFGDDDGSGGIDDNINDEWDIFYITNYTIPIFSSALSKFLINHNTNGSKKNLSFILNSTCIGCALLTKIRLILK